MQPVAGRNRFFEWIRPFHWTRLKLGYLDGSVVASWDARDFVLFLLFYVSKAAGGGRESLYQ
jgi:hypothetical protein